MTGRGHFFNLKMTKFTTFFTENNIEIKNKKFLLAASGGPDSVALLKMLFNFLPNPSEQLIVAHLDHCLRDDSFLESQLLQRLTSALKVKLVEKKWPVELHPGLKQKPESTVMHSWQRLEESIKLIIF